MTPTGQVSMWHGCRCVRYHGVQQWGFRGPSRWFRHLRANAPPPA